MVERKTCPKCNNPELQKNGYSYHQFGKYQRYRCPACGCKFIDNTGGKGRRKIWLPEQYQHTSPAPISPEKPRDRFFDIDVTTEVDYDT